MHFLYTNFFNANPISLYMPDKNFTWKDAAPSIIAALFFIAQIIYGFFYAGNTQNEIIAYVGVGSFILSGLFGMAPVIVFPKKGGVEKGKSFIHTKKIVTTGIYSVVRHPQYSAYFYWAIGAMCLFQHWVVVLLGIPVIVLVYFDMMNEDKRNIKKFGRVYKEYMNNVPRANVVIGLVLLLRRKR